MDLDENLIEKILRENIERQLEDYYFGDIITTVIKDRITKQVDEKIEQILGKEVETIFNSPIEVNDGWGYKEKYDNFEQLFKKKLNKKLEERQEINSTIVRELNRKFDKLIEEKMNYITHKFSETIMKELESKE